MRREVELQVQDIGNSRTMTGAYALSLVEVEGERAFSIIIGISEAQAIAMQMKGIVPPRPLTHHLFAHTLERLGAELSRILIYRMNEGVFYANLYLRTADGEEIEIDARTSDAIVLALRMGAPILIYEDILEECRQAEEAQVAAAAPQSEETASASRENHLELLRASLQKAIEEEDYEKAARLRDIIKEKEQEQS